MGQAQQHAIDHIVHTVRQEQVEAVLISGDIYDRALPPVEAVDMFDNALVALHEAGAQVVVTSGNHDSAIRLGFMSRLMRNVHIATNVAAITQPVKFDDSGVYVWTVPYLEPRLYAATLNTQANHTAIMMAVMERIRAEIEQHNLHQAKHLLMAHIFAAGGSDSASERDIGQGTEVGTLGKVPVDIFDPMDYVALGHLHGRQVMSDTVRYSGSPVAYSFSEHAHTKGVWLVDTDTMNVQAIDIPQVKRLAVLKDTISVLLESPDYAWAEEAWCQITVTDPQRPPQAFRRLKHRFPGMLNFILEPSGATQRTTAYSERIAKATTDMELVADFVDHVRNRPVNATEQQWFRKALDHVNAVQEQDVK